MQMFLCKIFLEPRVTFTLSFSKCRFPLNIKRTGSYLIIILHERTHAEEREFGDLQ